MTDFAHKLQRSITDAFCTDDPLAARAASTVATTGQELRYFCGGHQPVVDYQPPGPLCWGD
jgi:hypothetical protein